MTPARASGLPVSDWPPEACRGALPEVLDRIREPGLRLATWQRRLPAAITAWVGSGFLPPAGKCTWTLAPGQDAAVALDQALAGSVGSDGIGHARWQQDVLWLIALAWRIAPQSAALRVRIERVEDDGCRLFHVDRVALRLICTWLGTGTQWLPEGAFHRGGLGCGCNDHVQDWSALREVAREHVAVMKGEGYPGNAGHGLVHRSPPATRAHPRVLLAIDFG